MDEWKSYQKEHKEQGKRSTVTVFGKMENKSETGQGTWKKENYHYVWKNGRMIRNRTRNKGKENCQGLQGRLSVPPGLGLWISPLGYTVELNSKIQGWWSSWRPVVSPKSA